MKKSTIRRRYYDAPPNAELATDDTDEDDSARNALYPLVHAVFKVESLKDALQQLADSIDATVIVDQVTAADLPIRARLLNVPFDTAVALLASQARMHVVKRDRALYVTTLDDRRVREKLVREMLAVRFSVDGWPLVNVELARVPIRKALSQLSQDSNVPVVVDPAVKFDPEPLITENLGRCPIDLAVELVLEKYAPTLELVKHGQSLLITTKEAAGRRKIRK